jgi:hypothetical protein
MSSDTTSIFELPETQNSTKENITLQTQEFTNSLDPDMINKIVSGLQSVSENGLTKLPSRDIPMTSDNIVIDNHIQPNYSPHPPVVNNYMKEESIQNVVSKEQNIRLLDDYYNEIQNPLMIAILFFLFHLPIVKNKLFTHFPMFFHKDSSYNLKGLIIISILFGFIYYVLTSIIQYMSVVLP